MDSVLLHEQFDFVSAIHSFVSAAGHGSRHSSHAASSSGDLNRAGALHCSRARYRRRPAPLQEAPHLDPYSHYRSSYSPVDTPQKLSKHRTRVQESSHGDRSQPDPRLFVGSMDKGMRVLELFNEHDSALSIGDIAANTGMGRSAAQRFVYTLHWLGYLNKDSESKKYFPALKLLGLVRGIHRHHPQRELAYPLLERLARETRETVSWVELDGDEVVVLLNVPGAHVTTINLPVGSRFPALTSSSGQVLLSQAPQAQLLKMLDALPPEVRARFGSRSRAAILAVFRKAAEEGHSFTEKNFGDDGVSVSVPVTDFSGRPIAALNVSTVRSRFDIAQVRELILPRLKSAAREASI
ncbi:IclR family transcriptional regulator [Variovorax sp. LjRoot84]|uniref:IclR family transcriptional regulator n=1 Tax=Variovorax sp. LjRoot84 TaxID=3342340 RepID=UPI003F519FB4